MPNKRYEEGKRVVVYGLLGLGLGGVLLLVRKFFATPELCADLSSLAGGSILLFSNGCIFYGLLIFAGSREDGS
jgi:hypothetical protein